MKQEILLAHECTAIAAKNGLAGLREYALHLHSEKMLRDLSEFFSGSPTRTTGFYFNPACGEGGVIMATAGASHEEDGLEGVRFLFNPADEAKARAAVLSELHAADEQAATSAGPAFTVV